MTNDCQLEHNYGDLSCDTTTQHQPFFINLVDIKRTVQQKELACISLPFFPSQRSDTELNYLALSYRWGQLPKKIIDTGLGYEATLIAFDLEDLYSLCSMIMQDPELQYVTYVWVDAICVDHDNVEQRQATLYQMDKIYGQAKYILAVPDMHKGSLYETHPTNPAASMRGIFENRKTIYHLLHGNTEALLVGDAENINDESAMINRQQAISDAMDSLLNLFTEWSIRVLVISECVQAKKNNNLRLWFSLLGDAGIPDEKVVSFFNYDFDRPCIPCLEFQDSSLSPTMLQCYRRKYQVFYTTLSYQLRTQSFLEMMLNSKTKDRFKAILPISEYRDKLTSQAVVDQWQITDMTSVKLKLYEIMNIKDKWMLLLISGHPNPVLGSQHMGELPTFATTTLHFPSDQASLLKDDDEFISNVKWTDPTAILMSSTETKKAETIHKLTIKPSEYYLHHHHTRATSDNNDHCPFPSSWPHPPPLLQGEKSLDILCIPFICESAMKATNVAENARSTSCYWYARQLLLVGSFEKNKWVLTNMPCPKNVAVNPHWTLYKSNAGFDIY